MSTKTLVIIGAIIGSMVGSYIPALWGAGIFSFSSIILSGVGGIAGIWLGWKIAGMID